MDLADTPDAQPEQQSTNALGIADDLLPKAAKLEPEDVYNAIDRGLDAADGFRLRFESMRAEYLGHWSKSAAPDAGMTMTRDQQELERFRRSRRPVNLIQRVHDLYVPLLAPPTLGAKCTAKVQDLDPQAIAREMRINRILRQNEFHDALHDAVSNAMLGGEGYIMVDAPNSLFAPAKEKIDPYQVSITSVMPWDVVIDPLARDWASRQWQAVRTLVPRMHIAAKLGNDVARELPRWVEGVRDRDGGADRELVARYGREVDLLDLVALWQFWVFDAGECIWCVVADQRASAKFVVPPTPWKQLEGAPLVRVDLRRLAGRAGGVAPAQQIADLHFATDALASKMVNRALAAKAGLGWKSEDEEEAEKVAEAGDGFNIRYNSTPPTPMVIPGIAADDFNALGWMDGLANRVITDLNTQGGQGSAGSMSATQAANLQTNAAAIVAAMAGRVRKACTEVFKLVGRYIDAAPVQPMSFPQEGAGVETQIVLDEDTIEGEVDDFTYECETIDTAPMSPDMQLARAVQLIQMMPAVVQSHAAIFGPDVAMRIAGELARATRLTELAKVYDGLTLPATALALQQSQQQQQQGAAPIPGGRTPIQQQGADRASAGVVPNQGGV